MTYDFNAAGGEAALLEQFGFDNRDRYSYPAVSTTASSQNIPASTALMTMSQASRQSLSLSPGTTWLPLDMSGQVGAPISIHSPNSGSVSASSPEDQNAQSPGHHSVSVMSSPLQHQPSPFHGATHANPSALLADWSLPQQAQPHASPELPQFIHDPSLVSFHHFTSNYQPQLEYLPATTQAALEASLHLEPAFNSMSPVDAAAQAVQWGMGMANWQDFEAAMSFPQAESLPRMGSLGSHSPTGTYLEVLSLNSGSDNGWTAVDMYGNYDSYQQQNQTQNAAIFNPGQTLHLRTSSDSSDFGSYEEVAFPYSPLSPESDTYGDVASTHRNCGAGDHRHQEHHHHEHQHQQQPQPTASSEIISPAAAVAPLPIKAASTTSGTRATVASSSGSGSVSPPARRNSGPKTKSPIAKATKAVIRRTSTDKKDKPGEKKVGRRRGPLLPEQRKQASEIRKLRACLRCKFLKKTCDKGEPCAGCQPSHARLWQVPCTRIDIKDIGYFMKDWKADYERHLGRGMSVFNVKGFAQKETLMWITHGYGFCLPIMVREVFVADESCFRVDWVESTLQDQDPIDFEIRTERLDVGQDGVSMEAISEYLDKHVDEGFERFVEDHFEGTPFVSEILMTAFRFYEKQKLPVIRKALKLVVAYNLTLHITMVEQPPMDEQTLEGQIDDEDSKYFGKVVAPVMINFQIKCAMADMWRELQKEILEELSALYSSVYSGERLKNWPTIFMLASILLAVWEEIQFDCHYRVPDPEAVNKFCHDMETTPVGVIVGLFHAISQKLPAFIDWNTQRHGQLLNNNPAVCDAMTEVRQHVIKHESYLRTRSDSKFDRSDFDSLSNKFLSKLVIRSN
ncbi:hypothetical protein QBC46DRAFT_97182 [Diplogelasinospora grovesii]|uniref:C6 finger domain-containing protein n=1 Tax=Diplogelasinospora grovesii TaxID=303347 RepID=A0AAN6S5W5_9PEZI|nr:hypothetical protein QBC46DRAFT_97182 [Diplogelasinospora grovesii]